MMLLCQYAPGAYNTVRSHDRMGKRSSDNGMLPPHGIFHLASKRNHRGIETIGPIANVDEIFLIVAAETTDIVGQNYATRPYARCQESNKIGRSTRETIIQNKVDV